jgi:hypothetical protein
MAIHAILALVGCGAPHGALAPAAPGAATTAVASPSSSTGDSPDLCPDGQTNCGGGSGNGVGIYTAEDGFARIGPSRFLITHFINDGDAVRFDGRYYDTHAKKWLPLPSPGSVEFAEYLEPKKQLAVRSVTEVETAVTWRLHDPASITDAATLPVTDLELTSLKLHLRVDIPNWDGSSMYLRTERYVVDFTAADQDTDKQVVHRYSMRWLDPNTQQGPVPYCYAPVTLALSDGSYKTQLEPDPVVFQAGIAVDPDTGVVTRSTSDRVVTLSCRQGAPAAVFGWGYRYAGTLDQTFYFDAGIHMKRASYCRDGHYYTRAHTQLQIVDDKAIHGSSDLAGVSHLEAWWDRSGAICVNADQPNNLRHPEMGFTGSCSGKVLPRCSQLSGPAAPFLVEGPVNLPPLP